MGRGGRGPGRWWSRFALIRLQTPPSVTMVTGSTLLRRRIPCGTQTVSAQPQLIFPTERADLCSRLFAHEKVCGCLQSFGAGQRGTANVQRDKE